MPCLSVPLQSRNHSFELPWTSSRSEEAWCPTWSNRLQRQIIDKSRNYESADYVIVIFREQAQAIRKIWGGEGKLMTPSLNQSHQIDQEDNGGFLRTHRNRNIVHKGRDEGSAEWFVHGNTFSEYMDGVRCSSSSVCMFHCSAPFFFHFRVFNRT